MSLPNGNQPFEIGAQPLELEALVALAREPRPIALSQTARARIRRCHEFLQTQLGREDRAFYGINTGFGALCRVRISNEELATLQHNLVVSHACGTGEEVPAHLVRLMLVLKACNLAHGHSGVREVVVERLLDMYREDVLPVVYQQGSLGASGDLAPLAHLSLPLLGLGEVYWKGRRMAAATALDALGWQPLTLAPKEGLALLNGTQFAQAYAVWCVTEARRLAEAALMTAALACDAFDCLGTPFDARLHAIRPHAGQVRAAARLRHWLEDSPLQQQPKAQVQDPYAFRCMPQVAGASLDAIEYVAGVVHTEVNAVTDNPSLFPDSEAILSGGNFHAQPLALALDFLAIALAELGSIS
ncbi:MAG: aromatic amino acid lyase, partial [Bacteroidetes bacterium]